LQITEEASDDYEQTTTEEMSVVPAPAAVANSENVQAGLPKNMVPDPGWFDGDQTKFEDWEREYDYSSKVTEFSIPMTGSQQS